MTESGTNIHAVNHYVLTSSALNKQLSYVAGFEVEEASACVEVGRKLKYEAVFLDYPVNFYHLCCCITLWSVHVHTPHPKCSFLNLNTLFKSP